MQNSNATCQARARQHYDSSTRHKLDSLDRETRQKLDSFSTARQAGAWSQPRQARQARLSTGKASTTGSTAPRRSLDSSAARQPGLNYRLRRSVHGVRYSSRRERRDCVTGTVLLCAPGQYTIHCIHFRYRPCVAVSFARRFPPLIVRLPSSSVVRLV